MPRTNPAYPPEFKAEAVRLAQSGDKSIATIAHDLGVADQTLRSWVQQAEIDVGTRDGLTTNERIELAQLRREVRVLKQERDILKSAMSQWNNHDNENPGRDTHPNGCAEGRTLTGAASPSKKLTPGCSQEPRLLPSPWR
jgi:transposase